VFCKLQNRDPVLQRCKTLFKWSANSIESSPQSTTTDLPTEIQQQQPTRPDGRPTRRLLLQEARRVNAVDLLSRKGNSASSLMATTTLDNEPNNPIFIALKRQAENAEQEDKYFVNMSCNSIVMIQQSNAREEDAIETRRHH
jgi:hypothetical protein